MKEYSDLRSKQSSIFLKIADILFVMKKQSRSGIFFDKLAATWVSLWRDIDTHILLQLHCLLWWLDLIPIFGCFALKSPYKQKFYPNFCSRVFFFKVLCCRRIKIFWLQQLLILVQLEYLLVVFKKQTILSNQMKFFDTEETRKRHHKLVHTHLSIN